MTRNGNTGNGLEGRDAKSDRFLTGSNGGPGRKVGSRNKLGEAFIADLHDEWRKSGAGALKRLAQSDPGKFCQITASLLPRQLDETLNMNVSVFAEIRDFTEAYRLARRVIGAEEIELIEGDNGRPD